MRVGATLVAAALLSQSADAADKRKKQDYGGPPRKTSAGDVLAWPARVILFPPFVVNEFVLRRPLGFLVTKAESGEWVEKVQDVFSFGPRKQVTILPSALFDFGLKPSVGFNATWRHFLAEPNTLTLHGGTWGPRWISIRGSSSYQLTKQAAVSLDGTLVRRADNPFSGMGPFSKQDDRARYASTAWALGPAYTHDLWRTSSIKTSAGMMGLGFREGGCCGDPTLPDQLRDHKLPDAPGFGQDYVGGYHRMALVIDSRRPRPAPGSGFRIEAHEETVYTLQNTATSPRRAWVRYGGMVGGALDVTGTQRVLSLSLAVALADPLQGTIPFTDQVNVGGDVLMPGFLRSRLIGRSAMVGTLQYRWPIWVFLDGVIHAAVGNVFGERFDGLSVKDMRLSSGIGVRSNGSRESGFEALLAAGSDPFSEGFKVSSFRVLLGSHHGF